MVPFSSRVPAKEIKVSLKSHDQTSKAVTFNSGVWKEALHANITHERLLEVYTS
jgi:hypothetical protein